MDHLFVFEAREPWALASAETQACHFHLAHSLGLLGLGEPTLLANTCRADESHT